MANAAVKLTRRKVVQIGIENIKGTIVTPNLHVFAYDPVIQASDTNQTRQPSGAALGNFPAVQGEQVGTATLRTEFRSALAGDNTRDIDPGLSALLQACGYTLSPSANDQFNLQSNVSLMKTITVGMWEDGMYKRLHGCMGNLRITGEFGKPLMAEVDLSGVWTNQPDAVLPTASVNTRMPYRLRGVDFTLAGGVYTPRISTFTIDLGNTVTMVEDISKAQGVSHYVITGRDPVITMDALAEARSNYDVFALWLAETEAAMSMKFMDNVGIRGITIYAPKMQHRAPQEGDRDGKLTHEITAQLNVSDHDTGNDELSLTAVWEGSASSSPSSTPCSSPSSTPSGSPSSTPSSTPSATPSTSPSAT